MMGSLGKVRRNWEALARSDPLWAVLMDPARKGGGWTAGDFFDAGAVEVGVVFEHLAWLGIRPDQAGEALDFGCGPGRLAQALAVRFGAVVGVDASPTMIRLAREANERHNCRFLLNERSDLQLLDDDRFEFVYTSIVLQHMKPKLSAGYLRELARTCAPGGTLVFQLADRREAGDLSQRSAHRFRSLWGALWRLVHREPGVEMHGVPEAAVRRLAAESGLRVVDVQLTNSCEPEFAGRLRFLSGAPSIGWVSKQYTAVKGGEDHGDMPMAPQRRRSAA